jgi:hypothetical protein
VGFCKLLPMKRKWILKEASDSGRSRRARSSRASCRPSASWAVRALAPGCSPAGPGVRITPVSAARRLTNDLTLDNLRQVSHPRRNHFLQRRNRRIKLLIGQRLHAAGMLDLHISLGIINA